jgi:hypothetical protein
VPQGLLRVNECLACVALHTLEALSAKILIGGALYSATRTNFSLAGFAIEQIMPYIPYAPRRYVPDIPGVETRWRRSSFKNILFESRLKFGISPNAWNAGKEKNALNLTCRHA